MDDKWHVSTLHNKYENFKWPLKLLFKLFEMCRMDIHFDSDV
jgi:hypothetical protein